jgi:hypothetical protein
MKLYAVHHSEPDLRYQSTVHVGSTLSCSCMKNNVSPLVLWQSMILFYQTGRCPLALFGLLPLPALRLNPIKISDGFFGVTISLCLISSAPVLAAPFGEVRAEESSFEAVRVVYIEHFTACTRRFWPIRSCKLSLPALSWS